MKKILLAVTIIMLFPPAFLCQPAQVKKVVNNVVHYSKQSNTKALSKSGEVLLSGDEVSTGDKSFASILFTDDKSLLILREDSNVEIYGEKTDKGYSKNTVLNKGKLNFNVTHHKDQDFIFTTPTAVASIRGTTGYLESGSESGTTLYVDSGSVEFRSLGGNKLSGIVKSGMVALISKEGELKVEAANDQIKNEYKRTGNTNTKKVIIKTDKGDIIIDYLPEDK